VRKSKLQTYGLAVFFIYFLLSCLLVKKGFNQALRIQAINRIPGNKTCRIPFPDQSHPIFLRSLRSFAAIKNFQNFPP